MKDKFKIEYSFYIGLIIIVLGIIGSIVYISTFDWGAYNDIRGFTYTYKEEIEIMNVEMLNMFVTSAVILIASVITGVFFMMLYKIAWTLKKIQLRMTDTQ